MTKTLTLPSERLPTFGDSTVKDPSLTATEPLPGAKGGKVKWIGNATCIIEYGGIRFMTDPNFLHQGIFQGESLTKATMFIWDLESLALD